MLPVRVILWKDKERFATMSKACTDKKMRKWEEENVSLIYILNFLYLSPQYWDVLVLWPTCQAHLYVGEIPILFLFFFPHFLAVPGMLIVAKPLPYWKLTSGRHSESIMVGRVRKPQAQGQCLNVLTNTRTAEVISGTDKKRDSIMILPTCEKKIHPITWISSNG